MFMSKTKYNQIALIEKCENMQQDMLSLNKIRCENMKKCGCDSCQRKLKSIENKYKKYKHALELEDKNFNPSATMLCDRHASKTDSIKHVNKRDLKTGKFIK